MCQSQIIITMGSNFSFSTPHPFQSSRKLSLQYQYKLGARRSFALGYSFIWDEVLIQHLFCFEALEAVDRMLQDIRGSNHLFGVLSVVMGGDLAQILPAV